MKRWLGLAALICATPGNADQTLFAPMRNGAPFVCADLNELGVSATSTVGYWILGFWSGLNGAKNARVGDATTATGVIGEVKLYCASHPSESLPQATLDTYDVLRKPARQ